MQIHLKLSFCLTLSAGKCPFMHNATAEVTKLKAGEFVACACDYQEGACKKETTVDSGNYRSMTL